MHACLHARGGRVLRAAPGWRLQASGAGDGLIRLWAVEDGQEPRLGRWGRDGAGRNGVLVHSVSLEQ